MPATSAATSRQERHHWPLDRVRRLGATTDLATACSIVYKVGKSQAWERFNRGQLDFPAFKNGRSVIVPVAPLLRLLGMDNPPAINRAKERPGPFDGAKARLLREAAGFTLRGFAEDVGVRTMHLARVESGGCQPGSDLRARIARRLGVSPDALVSAALASDAA